MSPEILIIIIALFVGPSDLDNKIYIFGEPKFQTKESCAQFVKENSYFLNIYLSKEYGTLPKIYSNEFRCSSAKELKRFFDNLKENKGTLI